MEKRIIIEQKCSRQFNEVGKCTRSELNVCRWVREQWEMQNQVTGRIMYEDLKLEARKTHLVLWM